MRTTVRLDPDVAAAVARTRRERGIGVSEAVNELARAGMTVGKRPSPFRQRGSRLSLTIDVTNVAEALESESRRPAAGGPASGSLFA